MTSPMNQGMGNRFAQRWQAIDQWRPFSHRLAAPDERRLEDSAKCRAAVKVANELQRLANADYHAENYSLGTAGEFC